MGNTKDWEEYEPTAKNLLIFSTRKNFLNEFTSSIMKITIPSPSNSIFHLITPIKALFVALVIAVVLYFYL